MTPDLAHIFQRRRLPPLDIKTAPVFKDVPEVHDRPPQPVETACVKCSYSRVAFNSLGEPACLRCGTPRES